jgi:glycerophosphoryl diester phosphodiesterase
VPDIPRIIGHRGAAAAAPENTLAGIARAHALGCRWVELDAKLSYDRIALLMHDDRLERTTDGSGLFADRTAAELRRLDAGRWKAPEFAGEPIPTLAEAIGLMERLGMGANIEIKACPGREVETGSRVAAELRLLWPRGHGLLVSSFSAASLEAARAAAPELPRGRRDLGHHRRAGAALRGNVMMATGSKKSRRSCEPCLYRPGWRNAGA